ncbi:MULTISPECIES: DUF1656 domain-containing protein [Agrobacterium]|uniref:DUF1656 domain-containing protein n=2 Tax=Agrobacterium TaxID=357 RepID=A0A4D7Z3H5_AGRTU|nr:hypothetical protein RP75_19445 [Agrobacterium arsenijevicii]QCL96770.1 DUF1656 domain-containing protein [Agrobacterium tumefaciens]
MRNELDVFGIYVPSCLPVAIAALFVGSLVRKLLVHGGVPGPAGNRPKDKVTDTSVILWPASVLLCVV